MSLSINHVEEGLKRVLTASVFFSLMGRFRKIDKTTFNIHPPVPNFIKIRWVVSDKEHEYKQTDGRTRPFSYALVS
jgi:hypothetical protein